MRQWVLVRAVVIHLPDLFVSARSVDVVDLGLGDSRRPAEPQDDLVGKPMSDLACRVGGGVIAVLLGEHRRKLRIFGVEQEAVDR